MAYVASSAEDVPELLWLAPGAKEPRRADRPERGLVREVRAGADGTGGLAVAGRPGDRGPADAPAGLSRRAERTRSLCRCTAGRTGGRCRRFRRTPWRRCRPPRATRCCRPTTGAARATATSSASPTGTTWAAGTTETCWRAWTGRSPRASPTRSDWASSASSYGGFLVNWIIGHTERFRAAVSEFGIFSLVTDFSNSQAPALGGGVSGRLPLGPSRRLRRAVAGDLSPEHPHARADSARRGRREHVHRQLAGDVPGAAPAGEDRPVRPLPA